MKVANADMQSKTSLIEARLIIGRRGVVQEISEGGRQPNAWTATRKNTSPRALEDQAARRAKFGNSRLHAGAEHQERLRRPARLSKSAVDGVFQIPHPLAGGIAGSANLSARPSASNWRRPTIFCCACAPNCITTSTARWTCWAKICSRPWRTISAISDRSPSQRIEKFMRDLYTHTRNIYLITRTLEQRMALLPRRRKRLDFPSRLWLPRRRKAAGTGGWLQIHRRRNPRRFQPRFSAISRAGSCAFFCTRSNGGLQLHPDLAQLIRNQLSLVDREFLDDEHVRETFLTILDRRGEVAPDFARDARGRICSANTFPNSAS